MLTHQRQLHLTPAEFERLREISYQRHLAAGYMHTGRSGLTADRVGHSKVWLPSEGLAAAQEAEHVRLRK